MTPDQQIFIVNTPRMIYETVDQETVIIDTESGIYFNIGGSGSLVFQILKEGASNDTIVARLAAYYQADPASLRPAVEQFTADLLTEAIIVVADQPQDAQPAMLSAADVPALYTPPSLDKFTDMEELLLIDPIHEVQDRGWPYRA